MGELLDKLERAAKGTVQPLGFGAAAKREKVAPMLLLGAVEAGDEAQAKLAAEAGLDGAIVRGAKPAKKADVMRSLKAMKELTTGVWLEEATAKDPAGSDFQVFSSEATPLGSLGGDDRTNVMQVVPELEESLLHTIDYLPVDVFLVSLADADALTLSQLMRLARVRGATSRWLLVHLSSLPTKEELEQLREVGVSGVVVDLASHDAGALRGCLEVMAELPHVPPERNKAHSVATLPTAGLRTPGTMRPAPEPEPDDDDDDFDDD